MPVHPQDYFLNSNHQAQQFALENIVTILAVAGQCCTMCASLPATTDSLICLSSLMLI